MKTTNTFKKEENYKLLFEYIARQLECYTFNMEQVMQKESGDKISDEDIEEENFTQDLIGKYTQSVIDDIYAKVVGYNKARLESKKSKKIRRNMVAYLNNWFKWYADYNVNDGFMSELEFQGYSLGVLDSFITLGTHNLVSLAGKYIE